jgi:hypothetical protein
VRSPQRALAASCARAASCACATSWLAASYAHATLGSPCHEVAIQSTCHRCLPLHRTRLYINFVAYIYYILHPKTHELYATNVREHSPHR